MKRAAHNLQRFLMESISTVYDGRGIERPFRCTVGRSFPHEGDGVNIVDTIPQDPGENSGTRDVHHQITVESRSNEEYHAMNLIEACHRVLANQRTDFVLSGPVDGLGDPLLAPGPSGPEVLEDIRVLKFEGLSAPRGPHHAGGWHYGIMDLVVHYQLI